MSKKNKLYCDITSKEQVPVEFPGYSSTWEVFFGKVSDKPIREKGRFRKLKGNWVRDYKMGMDFYCGPENKNPITSKQALTLCKKVGGHLPNKPNDSEICGE